MDKKLEQLATEHTIDLDIKWVLTHNLADKNFSLIKDCLQELVKSHAAHDKHIQALTESDSTNKKDIQSLKTQVADLKRLLGIKSKPGEGGQLQGESLSQLTKRLNSEIQENKNRNLEHLKDINLMMGELKELKSKIGEIDGKMDQVGGMSNIVTTNTIAQQTEQSKKHGGKDLEHTRVIQNELQKHLESIKDLQRQTSMLREKDSNLEEKVRNLESKLADLQNTVNSSNYGLNNSNSNSNIANFPTNNDFGNPPGSQGSSRREADSGLLRRIEELEKYLKSNTPRDQKLYNLSNKLEDKLNELHDLFDELGDLKAWMAEVDEHFSVHDADIAQLKNILALGGGSKNGSTTNSSANLSNLKKEAAHQNEHRLLREMLMRLEELEGAFKDRNQKSSSLKDINDDRLPALSGNTKRQLKLKTNKQPIPPPSSAAKERSTSSAKELREQDVDRKIHDLRGELQQWLKQLFESKNSSNKKDEDAMKELQLRIQEIKMMLQKKADQEGMKKYLTFLETKVNNLYMMFAQPESEDALIARKGWGCLSCAKKLEKYKGRLGEHVNWNNMTTTNYSPPRVGFTQTQKQSSGKHRFASLIDNSKHAHFYDEDEKFEKFDNNTTANK